MPRKDGRYFLQGKNGIPGGLPTTEKQGAPGMGVTDGRILLGWLLSMHLRQRQLAVRVLALRESD